MATRGDEGTDEAAEKRKTLAERWIVCQAQTGKDLSELSNGPGAEINAGRYGVFVYSIHLYV